MVPGAKWGLEMRGDEHRCRAAGGRAQHLRSLSHAGGAGARTPLNEVVCGAMMLAYERGGKWNEVRGPVRVERVELRMHYATGPSSCRLHGAPAGQDHSLMVLDKQLACLVVDECAEVAG